MLRFIAKWYISRSIDSGQEVPGWVNRRLAVDASLRHFRESSLQLVDKLRSHANGDELASGSVNQLELFDSGMGFHSVPPIRSTVTAANVIAFAMAAGLLGLMIGYAFLDQSDPVQLADGERVASAANKTQPEEQPAKGNQPRFVESAKIESLLATSQSLAQAWKVKSEQLAKPTFSTEQWEDLLDVELSQIVIPVSVVGSRYGGLLRRIDQDIETEQRLIVASGAEGFRFFVHKLPRSIAALAGR